MQKLKAIFANRYFILILWFGLSLFAVIKGVLFGDNTTHSYNNYIIYKYNFLNLIHQHSLFPPQPEFYFDLNHYGPVFALVIAPFTFFPDKIGVILWVFFNAWILYKAVIMLPLSQNQRLLILLLNANSLMGSSGNVEVNPLITALIIFSFVFIRKKQDFWAAFAIVLGTAIKLYGIVGLAFFFFSDNKPRLILSTLFWSVVLFTLPMLISSPAYIITTYRDWYPDLVAKNLVNQVSNRADECVMGMISKIFNIKHLANMWVLIPALFVFGLSYIKTNYWQNVRYQLPMLSSVLIFTVIYSTGSEPPTYIIAFIGVAIWFMNLNHPNGFEWSLLIFALVVTSFSGSDIIPRYIRVNYIIRYALIALPCLLIWLKIIYEMLTRKFELEVAT